MTFKANDYIDMIEQEIEWCLNHKPDPLTCHEEFSEGFIKGLKQAIYIIEGMKILR
jgi:lysyl-tRNA synthetase class I